MRLDNVVGARKYSFKDKDSQRLVEGVNVFFLEKANSADDVGQIPNKISVPYHEWDNIRMLPFPVACEAVLEQVFSSKGIKTKVVSLTGIFPDRK
jgi:hypothetical protein